jgi:hypothetical protein
VRAEHPERRHETADVLAIDVVLRVGVAVRDRHLRMRLDHVIGFEERLDRELPIARQPFLDV